VAGGLIFAAVAVASALAVAFAANRWVRRRADRAPIDLGSVSGRVVFFSDEACRRCPAARDTLTATGVDFEEVAYSDDPKRFRATGAPAVPLVVVRGPDGTEVGRIAGEVGSGELRALLRRAGL
jgi:glutaredoxin